MIFDRFLEKIEVTRKIGHLHWEVMWHRFYENESYMILHSNIISGSSLKQNNSDLVFQTHTICLKWESP